MKKTLSLSVCIFYPKHSRYEEDIILVCLYLLPKTFKLWRRHYPCLFVSFNQNIQIMKKTLSLSVYIFYPKHSSYKEDIILVCLYPLPKTFKLWRRHYPCLFVSFTQNIQVMKKTLSLSVCIFYPHSTFLENLHQLRSMLTDYKAFISYAQCQQIRKPSSATFNVNRLENLHQLRSMLTD